jgi:hypothetical protein
MGLPNRTGRRSTPEAAKLLLLVNDDHRYTAHAPGTRPFPVEPTAALVKDASPRPVFW